MNNNKILNDEILLIADAISSHQILLEKIIVPHYTLQIAETAQAGLEKISKAAPLLILLSIHLKDKNSFEFCSELKNNPLTKDITIILFSSENNEALRIRGFESGATDFIFSAMNEKEILARIKIAFNTRQTQIKMQKELEKVTDLDTSKAYESESDYFKDKYRSMVENANDIVFSINMDGTLTYGSPNWNSIFGHDVNDHIGKSVFESLIHPEDIPGCLNVIEKTIETKERQSGIEYRVLHKDGGWRWQRANTSPVIDKNGSVISLLGIGRDISEEKNAKEALLLSEQSYQGLFNAVAECIYILDEDGLILDVNASVEKTHGYTREELLGKSPSLLSAHGENKMQPISDLLQNKNAENIPEQFTIQAKTKENKVFIKEVNYAKGKHWGQDVMIVSARDITERKKTEEALKESEEKYRVLVENAMDIIYTFDKNLIIKSFNNVGVKLLGYTFDEVIGKSADFVLNDMEMEFSKRMLQNKLDGQEKTRYELSLIAKDGKIIPVEVQTQLIYKDGLFDGIQGIARDITERKKADKALQQTLLELSDYKYALDQAANVSISDQDGFIKYVNESFCKQYGYTADEIIGQNHDILNSGFHPQSFWEEFWETIQKGQVLKAEVRNKAKDGTFQWSDTTIVPFLNDEGLPYQYLSIRRDITEKRRLEQELAFKQINNQKLITELTIESQEKERKSISHELHENINQVLAGAKIYLGIYQSKNKEKDEMFDKGYDYLNIAMDQINKLSNSLVTGSLSDFGLLENLVDLVDEINKTKTLKVILDNKAENLNLIKNKQMLMLYRIVQEQINNIITHAEASTVKIQLSTLNNKVYLTISDDGVGFDTTQETKGFGYVYIKNRVEFYHGSLNIISSPGNGCILDIIVPINDKPRENVNYSI